jgi:hypothetical protein
MKMKWFHCLCLMIMHAQGKRKEKTTMRTHNILKCVRIREARISQSDAEIASQHDGFTDN